LIPTKSLVNDDSLITPLKPMAFVAEVIGSSYQIPLMPQSPFT